MHVEAVVDAHVVELGCTCGSIDVGNWVSFVPVSSKPGQNYDYLRMVKGTVR